MPSLDDVDLRKLLLLEADLTHKSLDGIIEFIRDHYGLANIAYVCPALRGCCITDPFLALAYSDIWVEHFQGEGYSFVNPVAPVGERSIVPVDWAYLPRFEKRVQRLFTDASEAGGGTQGLTIPVRGPANGVWALFSVTSYDSHAEWSARRYELMRDMVKVAHFVHQKAYELHVAEAKLELDALTKWEIEALQWAAEGSRLEEIGIMMRISVETVRAHLDSARYKLKALNRTHAITKAIRARLIR